MKNARIGTHQPLKGDKKPDRPSVYYQVVTNDYFLVLSTFINKKNGASKSLPEFSLLTLGKNSSWL